MILLTISLIKNVILDPLGGASIRVTDGNAQKEESRKSTYTTALLTAQQITDHACMMISWIVVLVDTCDNCTTVAKAWNTSIEMQGIPKKNPLVSMAGLFLTETGEIYQSYKGFWILDQFCIKSELRMASEQDQLCSKPDVALYPGLTLSQEPDPCTGMAPRLLLTLQCLLPLPVHGSCLYNTTNNKCDRL